MGVPLLPEEHVDSDERAGDLFGETESNKNVACETNLLAERAGDPRRNLIFVRKETEPWSSPGTKWDKYTPRDESSQ